MAFRKNPNPSPKTLFGAELQRLLDEKGMSLRDLSDKVGGTYEYSRLLVRGDNLPSAFYLRALSSVLKVDFDDLDAIVKRDRFNRDFGSMMSTTVPEAALPPDLAQFHRTWPHLNQKQKEMLLQMLAVFAPDATQV